MELRDYKVGDEVEVLLTIHKIDGATKHDWYNARVVETITDEFDYDGLRVALDNNYELTIWDTNRIRLR